MPTSSALTHFVELDSALAEDLQHSSAPEVRDIIWLLHAPDMITLEYLGRPSLESLGLDDPRTRAEWISQQNLNHDRLLAHLAKRRSKRLGIYHESLWQWIFQHAPNTQLIAHNIALRSEKRTLGELDLLYQQNQNLAGLSETIHAELAIKFYLGLPYGPGDQQDAARWIGMGSFDSLAIKSNRIIQQQFPIAKHPKAQASLTPFLQNQLLTQRCIMPGVLFHPWRQQLQLPRLASIRATQGIWCSVAELRYLLAELPQGTQAQRMVKPHWLAFREDTWKDLDVLQTEIERHFIHYDMLWHLYLRLPNGMHCRLFVVKNEWPNMLPLPPLECDNAVNCARQACSDAY